MTRIRVAGQAWTWFAVVVFVDGLLLIIDWRQYWPLAALILFVALLLATVLVFPSVVANRDREGLAEDVLKESASVRNEVRTALLQGFASIMLLVGAGFAFNQLRASQRELQTSAEGQQTERFSRAIEHLGSKEGGPVVRLGGIFTLIDIANIDSDQRAVVAQILAAYVEEHAPRRGALPPADATPRPLALTQADLRACLDFLAGLAPGDEVASDLVLDDVVLPGLNFDDGEASLERAHLRGADLSGLSMVGGRLAGADLRAATMSRAHLQEADLTGALLVKAHLSGGDLSDTDLDGADLSEADLTGVNFHRASLRGAILVGANLSAAKHLDGDLAGADLRHAQLGGADLRSAENLLDANLTDAVCDGRTKLPDTVECRGSVVVVKG